MLFKWKIFICCYIIFYAWQHDKYSVIGISHSSRWTAKQKKNNRFQKLCPLHRVLITGNKEMKKWCKNFLFFLFMFCVEIKFEVRIWGHDMNKDFINNSSAYYQRIVAINQNINIFRIFHFCLLISHSRALFGCRNGIYTHFRPKVRSSIKFTTIHI